MSDMLMACFSAWKTPTEASLKGKIQQPTWSRVDISTIKNVKLVEKDTKNRARSSDSNSIKSTKASPRNTFVSVFYPVP